MAKIERDRIKKEKLILCEGRDEENFLISWLNSDELSDEPGFSNEIQVLNFEGNSDLSRQLEKYRKMDGFDNLTHLMIIRDAEHDSDGAVKSIQSALSNNGFQVPEESYQWICDNDNDLYIGFLLFPACDKNPTAGTLEDLCLKILAKSDASTCMEEVNIFLERLEKEHGKNFSHKFKTQLHAYFAVSDDYVGMKIGEAAGAKAFNWSSSELEPLKNFVLNMIK